MLPLWLVPKAIADPRQEVERRNPTAVNPSNTVPALIRNQALALGLADLRGSTVAWQGAKGRRLSLQRKRETAIAAKHSTFTIKSTFSVHIQAGYCYRPLHNTSLIDAQVFSLLWEHALLPIAPKILPPVTDIVIPSTHLDSGKARPAYWVIKKSNLLLTRIDDGYL
ncbi:hypothetical protein EHS25_000880 [Saitozyma podzolica]|uniref:Uncharacterized protein n=1 Tax=Saitozyma podzolica TaxID=1890683 RepID=A0A427YXH1_9TREE|nr:hypothetical protein EHS25_000880 [Saitozyma podzolica]